MSGLTVAQVKSLRAVVAAVPARSGIMERTLGHEPKNAPGRGFTCSVFVKGIRKARSGLSSTSLVIDWYVRIQTPMLSDPEDDIDPELVSVALTVMAGYAAGFTLSGLEAEGIDVRSIDIRGMEGTSMDAPFGYHEHDRKEYRAVLITVPIILNHVLPEVP